MYLIELIVKIFTHKKEKNDFDYLGNNENPDYETCNHVFMPIDSENETLSCTKCGILVNRKEIKFKNFFVR